MKQIPILFSTPMVQAILDGRKTQTRRLIKPQPNGALHDVNMGYWSEFPDNLKHAYIKCPYGKPGDVLWVRETYRHYMELESEKRIVEYAADGAAEQLPLCDGDGFHIFNKDGSEKMVPWIPSIHMPKSACRIYLQITDIRVERLQDISEEDAKAEGVLYYGDESGDYKDYTYNDVYGDDWGVTTAKKSFGTLWESINGPESWNANPWVWVISFERIDKPKEV